MQTDLGNTVSNWLNDLGQIYSDMQAINQPAPQPINQPAPIYVGAQQPAAGITTNQIVYGVIALIAVVVVIKAL